VQENKFLQITKMAGGFGVAPCYPWARPGQSASALSKNCGATGRPILSPVRYHTISNGSANG